MYKSEKYHQNQCPNCGSRNTSIEKEEYMHPEHHILGVRGDTTKVSPASAKLQVIIFQVLCVFGIIGFASGLITGTWSKSGETRSIEGSPFQCLLVLFVIMCIWGLFVSLGQGDRINDIKKFTYHHCLDCSYHWRFPRYLFSLNSSTIDAEIAKSEEFYQTQMQHRILPETQIHHRVLPEIKETKNHNIFKWVLGLLTIISALLLWKNRKK